MYKEPYLENLDLNKGDLVECIYASDEDNFKKK